MISLGPKIAPSFERAFNEQFGFTLIELMVVVGIIGIMVSLAVPQYNRYQRKAIQSESKIAMGSIYALEKGFYSEYSAYIPGFDAIGYTPEGKRRFYFQFICTGGPYAGTVTGYSGSAAVSQYNSSNSPYVNTNTFNGYTCGNTACASFGNDPQTFIASTQGNLGTPYDDLWQIDQSKVLKNCGIGI
jgi:prepilin-type N-terminal cleavage/methylation domain-containing protein